MRRWIPVSVLVFALASASAIHAEAPPTQLWVQEWNSPSNHEDEGLFLAVDTPNRIYVAGTTYNTVVFHDYLLLQYDANGNLIWERTYGGNNDDNATDVRVPAPGEVVITGVYQGANGNEVATAKYDAQGNLLWDRHFSAPGILTMYGPRMAIDGARNIYVSGVSNNDYLVLKYAPDGTLLWSQTHHDPNGGPDIATDIAADSDGSVYETGVANNSTRFMTVKFSPTGSFVWEQFESGDIGSVFAPSHVAVGPDHDVVVAGSPESTCGLFQFKIWKVAASSGNILWSDTAPAQPCSSFTFQDMTLDVHGNILAVCTGSETGVDTHMQVLRYSPDGTRQWLQQFDGPGTAEDVASSITTDGVGAAYAVGYTDFPPQNRDYAAVKFSADGTQQWAIGWASSQGTNDIGEDIVVDPAGDVILTGHSYNPTSNEDAVTVKFHQESAAATPGIVGAGAAGVSLRVSPNPVIGSTEIRYALSREGAIRLDLLAPDGRRVRTLVDALASAGPHAIRWEGTDGRGARLPAGAYVVRLQAGGNVATAKLSIIR